jgi:hypothetical protein
VLRLRLHQDLQLLAVTGHAGGARGVHTQTLRGGAALRAAVSNVTAVFLSEENKDREKVKVLIHYLHKGIQYVICTYLCVYWKNYILTFFLSNFYLLIHAFSLSPLGGSRVKGSS